jgi:outer membrane protein TolC
MLSLQQALDATLRQHPQARIGEQQVLASRGAQRAASGIFDPIYTGGLQQNFAATPLTTAQQVQDGGGPTAADLNVTSFNAGASRLYRSGITAGPVAEVDRTRDRILNAGGINQSRLAYQLTVPLARNKGSEVVAAQERSAGVQVEASQFDLNQTYTDLLTNTAVSYWNLVGAIQFLNVAMSSEARGQSLLQNVVDLIQAEHVPRNDMNQVRANLADRVAGRIAATQQVVAARLQLALAMGTSAEDMASIADLADQFPEGIGAPADGPEASRRYLALALSQRADYLAAQRRSEAERTLLAQAKMACGRLST